MQLDFDTVSRKWQPASLLVSSLRGVRVFRAEALLPGSKLNVSLGQFALCLRLMPQIGSHGMTLHRLGLSVYRSVRLSLFIRLWAGLAGVAGVGLCLCHTVVILRL